MVTRADGAQLVPCALTKLLPVACRNSLPGFGFEEGVFCGSIACPVRAANAEGEKLAYLVGKRRQIEVIAQDDVGSDGRVSAGDIEANACHAHLVPVGRHSAYRHNVAQVAVGHQRDTLGVAGDLPQLAQGRLVMVSKDLANLTHEKQLPPPRGYPGP